MEHIPSFAPHSMTHTVIRINSGISFQYFKLTHPPSQADLLKQSPPQPLVWVKKSILLLQVVCEIFQRILHHRPIVHFV